LVAVREWKAEIPNNTVPRLFVTVEGIQLIYLHKSSITKDFVSYKIKDKDDEC